MTTLLQRLFKPINPSTVTTVKVIALTSTGALVSTGSGTKEVASAANLKFAIGDTVKVQGDLIIAKQNTARNLTTYQI